MGQTGEALASYAKSEEGGVDAGLVQTTGAHYKGPWHVKLSG